HATPPTVDGSFTNDGMVHSGRNVRDRSEGAATRRSAAARAFFESCPPAHLAVAERPEHRAWSSRHETRRRSPSMKHPAITFLLFAFAAPARASNDLYFTEYVEGSSNNKALEIYNNTGTDVDLSTYKVSMYFNGSSSAGLTINLTGTVVQGDVFVLAHSLADPAILAVADQTAGGGWFNGDDAVALIHGS